MVIFIELCMKLDPFTAFKEK